MNTFTVWIVCTYNIIEGDWRNPQYPPKTFLPRTARGVF